MPTRRKLSVSTQVVLALLLGVLVGLFFGEHIAFLQPVGRAFILLLQMTVLPYIVLSLMTGLGSLNYQQVKTLALRVGILLVISWGLAFLVILLMPLAFPTWVSASFFSTSLIEKQEDLNLFTLFIPSNPFFSLSNNFVPAVVELLFDAEDETSIMSAHIGHDGWPDKLARLAHISESAEIARLLAACLRRDPQNRPTANQARRALREITPKLAGVSFPLGPPSSRPGNTGEVPTAHAEAVAQAESA
jgi:hypothetical protein